MEEDKNATEKLIGELREFVMDTLDLEDIAPEEIGAETPLFSEDGLGLDSIDAMELAVALKRRYRINITEQTENLDKHFSCLASLAEFIKTNKN